MPDVTAPTIDHPDVVQPEAYDAMQGYCRFLLENKHEEFAMRQLALSREMKVPLLKLLDRLPEDQLKQIVLTGLERLLRAFMEGKIDQYISETVHNWITNQLPAINAGDVVAEDITLVSLVRKRMFRRYLDSYTDDPAVHARIIDEVDLFLMKLETVCFKTYGDLLTKRLKRNEQLYKQAQAISHLGNWTWDIATGKVEWTDELYRIFGLEPQSEVSFERYAQLLHPDDRDLVLTEIQAGAAEKRTYQFTHRVVRPDGDVRIIQARGEPLLAADGSLSGMVGTGQDITEDTERKKAEAQLRESEARFRAVADSAPVLIWLSGTDKAYQYFNKGWLDYTGRAFTEEHGNGWLNHVHPDDRELSVDSYNEAFDARKPFATEFRLLRHDGQYRWLLNHGVPRVSPDGGFLGYIGTCTDIHERKKIREVLQQKVDERTADLQRANRELERSNAELLSFSYVASHDLQEPLRKIQTFSSRILDREYNSLTESGRDAFNRISQAAARMKQLIEDLLAYSRTNRSSKVFEKVDVNALLGELASNQKDVLLDKKATLTWDVGPRVNAIPFQLYQLFENIVNNAIKYAKPGVAPVIHIGYALVEGSDVNLEHVDRNRSYHCFSIKDNGIGFDQKHAERIFEVFQRLHHREQYPGTGIGLAICKRIVDNHHGFITAHSEPDQGSVFKVFLPVATATNEENDNGHDTQ